MGGGKEGPRGGGGGGAPKLGIEVGAGAGVIPEGVAELAFQRGDEGVGGGGGAELGGVGDGQRQAGECAAGFVGVFGGGDAQAGQAVTHGQFEIGGIVAAQVVAHCEFK